MSQLQLGSANAAVKVIFDKLLAVVFGFQFVQMNFNRGLKVQGFGWGGGGILLKVFSLFHEILLTDTFFIGEGSNPLTGLLKKPVNPVF